jgi:CRISPR-associated protein Cmr3
MTLFLIEPRDPLIARDGRPAGLGGSLATLPFPTSSTIAGAARTRMASIEGAFQCPEEDLDHLLEIPVHGPILAELEDAGETVRHWLLPAPRDAVFYGAAGAAGEPRMRLHRLIPMELPSGCGVDDAGGHGLLLPGFARDPGRAKPYGHAPAFWRWQDLAGWLGAVPSDGGAGLAGGAEGGVRVGDVPPGREAVLADGDELDPACFGLRSLPAERRVHLAIEPGERVGVEGYLFQTKGLRFLLPGKSKLAPVRLALSLRTPGGRIAGRDLGLRSEVAPLGGDRRLARWREASAGWPALPESIVRSIVSTRRARLLLLTPAAFAGGALPAWHGEAIPDAGEVRVRVRCACVGRAEVVSGWDLRARNPETNTRGRAKPTRRLAPAGSVYFVELEGGDAEAVAAWCRAVWFQSVSDVGQRPGGQEDRQARRDGFGLCALGTWTEPVRKETP